MQHQQQKGLKAPYLPGPALHPLREAAPGGWWRHDPGTGCLFLLAAPASHPSLQQRALGPVQPALGCPTWQWVWKKSCIPTSIHGDSKGGKGKAERSLLQEGQCCTSRSPASGTGSFLTALSFNPDFEEPWKKLKCCICLPVRVKRNHLFCQALSEVAVNTVNFSSPPPKKTTPCFRTKRAKSFI